ncbi:MAG: type II secretion system protein M [Verrucomicrobia bacterium]|nr:type II secretion system protein M [Verrucomicrobiota bacterium]
MLRLLNMTDRYPSVQIYITNNPRKVGLLFLFVGIALIYWKVVQPIQIAEERTQKILLSMKFTILGVVGCVYGLIYIIFGPRAAPLLRPAAGESRVAAFIAAILACGIGYAIYLGVKHYVGSKGYL